MEEKKGELAQSLSGVSDVVKDMQEAMKRLERDNAEMKGMLLRLVDSRGQRDGAEGPASVVGEEEG